MMHRGPVDHRLAHVAEGHDVLGGNFLEVGRSPAAHADHGDVELLVQVPAAHDRRHGQGTQGRARDCPPELTARRPYLVEEKYVSLMESAPGLMPSIDPFVQLGGDVVCPRLISGWIDSRIIASGNPPTRPALNG